MCMLPRGVRGLVDDEQTVGGSCPGKARTLTRLALC
jgi:hypothetical protein